MRRLALLLAACGSTQSAPREPPPPSCDAVADHVRTLLDEPEDHERAVHSIFATRCERDRWAAEPRRCIVETRSLADPQNCKAKLTPAQRDVLDRELRAADRAARAARLPAECEEYKALVARLASCDKVPQQSRDALKQGLDAMSESWKNIGTMSDEFRRDLVQGCRAGADALKQAVGSLCGW